jgi:hypothetical protein
MRPAGEDHTAVVGGPSLSERINLAQVRDDRVKDVRRPPASAAYWSSPASPRIAGLWGSSSATGARAGDVARMGH